MKNLTDGIKKALKHLRALRDLGYRRDETIETIDTLELALSDCSFSGAFALETIKEVKPYFDKIDKVDDHLGWARYWLFTYPTK